MEKQICSVCGSPLMRMGDHYECKYCGFTFTEDYQEKSVAALEKLLNEAKMEALANAKKVLFDAVHVKYPSKEAVVNAANAVLLLNPDDPLAKVYLYSHDADPYRLNEFLAGLFVSPSEAKEVLAWLLPSLHARTGGPLKHFAERHFRNEELTKALTDIEEVIAKVDEGVYEAGLMRDVFVAYSSADMSEVIHIIDILEENNLTCFAAFRNMRHGKGSAENYLSLIQQAINSCRLFLFLSSPNSLSASCDAIRVEIPYLIVNQPSKARIQYVLKDTEHIAFVVNKTLKAAFPNQERCRDEEDLIERIYGLLEGNTLSSQHAQKPPSASIKDVPTRVKERKKPPQSTISVGHVITMGKMDGFAPQPSFPAPDLADFKIKDGVLMEYSGNGGNVVIPPSVTSIGDKAFLECLSLSSVIIPPSVTSIGDKAFQDCLDLSSVIIPPSVASIGESAFEGCSSLSSITIPSSVTTIGSGAFFDCSSLSSVTIPSSVTTIGSGVFFGCSSLSSVTIPEGVTSIGANFFFGCSSLSSVTIPEGVTSIGVWAFYECRSLSSVSIPSSVVSIGRSAFFRCSSLAHIYCEAPARPKTWRRNWKKGCRAKVHWGYKG